MSKFLTYFLISLLLLLLIGGVLIRNPIFVSGHSTEMPGLKENLEDHVKMLTSLSPARNYKNLSALNSAATYIEDQLERSCDSLHLQKFEVSGNTYHNIRCLFSGHSKKRIVIGAHYDVAYELPGADDNASGAAVIIELARLLKQNNQTLPHDVEIVAYSLEEPPFFSTKHMGSYHHAQSLVNESIDVELMISVEIVGFYSDKLWSQTYPLQLLYLFYPARGNFIGLIGGLKEYFGIRAVKRKMAEAMSLPIYSLNGVPAIPGLDYSDHMNYWNAGFFAYMLTDTSFYRNPHYHKESDTIDTLSFEAMAEVTKGLHNVIAGK